MLGVKLGNIKYAKKDVFVFNANLSQQMKELMYEGI